MMDRSEPEARARANSHPPRLWLVVGDKLGDNAQIEIIAETLGWPFERKRLRFREPYVLGKPPFRPSLYHVDLECSDALAPPWPDLILTVGRRPSMAAMWIREQGRERPKVVIVGRPKRMIDAFALVIVPPQFRVPARANVLHLDLPLMRVAGERIAAAAGVWKERLADLERPLTAVLVGGPTKPFGFDAAVVRELVAETVRSAGEARGTLFFTTSRRTPAAVVAALRAELPPSARLFEWAPGAADNPYLGLLGLADRFVVTGDSISMMVEVARLGRPLAIFPLPVRLDAWGRARQGLGAWLHTPRGGPSGRFAQWLGHRLFDLNLVGYSRDLTALHDRLIEGGMAVRLGTPFPPTGGRPPDDLPRAVERIKGLFAAP